jgi:hypothetical protein
VSHDDAYEIRRLIDKGLAHYGRGEFYPAAEQWQRALGIDPDNQEATTLIEFVRDKLAPPGSEGWNQTPVTAQDDPVDESQRVTATMNVAESFVAATPKTTPSATAAFSAVPRTGPNNPSYVGENPITQESLISELLAPITDPAWVAQYAEQAKPGAAIPRPVPATDAAARRAASLAEIVAKTPAAPATRAAQPELQPLPDIFGETLLASQGGIGLFETDPTVPQVVTEAQSFEPFDGEATRAMAPAEILDIESEHELFFEEATRKVDVQFAQTPDGLVLQTIDSSQAAAAAGKSHTEQARLKATEFLNACRRAWDQDNLEQAVVTAEGALRQCDLAPPPGIADVIDEAHDLFADVFGKYIGSDQAIPLCALAPEALALRNLDHHAGFLLSRIDGVCTVEQIVDFAGIPRVQALRFLVSLMRNKVIRLQ